MAQNYPVQFDVDYPKKLNRISTFFRLILAIPIVFLFSLVVGSFAQYGISVGGLIFLPVLFMILFRKKYPRWWFDWNLELLRFSTRVGVYMTFLRGEYPSTDEQQAVHLRITYPNAKRDLNRWLPLIRWLLAAPHYIVLIILSILSFLATVIAWFAILFTGKYPKGLFDFVVGVSRWSFRVYAYAFLLVTDKYPPFSLK